MSTPVRMIVCGGCDRQIPADSSECGLCGWENHNALPAPARGAESGQCDYELNGRRCPLPAVYSPSLTAKGPKWCRAHANERHYDAAAAEELDRIIADPRAWLPEDWRNVALREVMAAHPEWQRQVEESRSEYRARMMGIARTLRAELLRNIQAHAADEQARSAPAAPPLPRDAARARAAAAPAPTPSAAAVPAEDVIADAVDQFAEYVARLEADGISGPVAQQMAVEEVLRARLGSAA